MDLTEFLKATRMDALQAKKLLISLFGVSAVDGVAMPAGSELVLLFYILLKKARVGKDAALCATQFLKDHILEVASEIYTTNIGRKTTPFHGVIIQDERYVSLEGGDSVLDLADLSHRALSLAQLPLPVYVVTISLTGAYLRTFGTLESDVLVESKEEDE
jgi:hypothetical protein